MICWWHFLDATAGQIFERHRLWLFDDASQVRNDTPRLKGIADSAVSSVRLSSNCIVEKQDRFWPWTIKIISFLYYSFIYIISYLSQFVDSNEHVGDSHREFQKFSFGWTDKRSDLKNHRGHTTGETSVVSPVYHHRQQSGTNIITRVKEHFARLNSLVPPTLLQIICSSCSIRIKRHKLKKDL